MKKISILLLLLLVSSLILFSANYGGSIGVAIPTDISETIDPHKATGALTFEILYNIYEGLIQVDRDGRLVGLLATDWSISEDGLQYTFKLKKDVYFHDGSPFTSEDVKFTYERVMDPKTGYAKASNYMVIEDIQTPDDYTVHFFLTKPYSPFLALVSKIHILPSDSDVNFDLHTVGTGPFYLEEWNRDSYLHLIQFEDYHVAGIPYLNEAYFRVIPDENSRFISLQTGVVDAIPRIDQSFMRRIERDPSIKYERAPMNLVQFMAINNKREPLDDLRIRQAINFSIDRELLIEFVAEGLARPVTTHMTLKSPYALEYDKYPYNPEKAMDLLKKAGYAFGELELTIALPQPYEFHQRTGEVVAQMLESVGIKTKLQIVEWGTWISDVYNGRDYDMTIIGIEGEPDPYIYLDRFYSDASRNFTNVNSDEIDQWLNQLATESEFEVRKQLVNNILKELVDMAASVWLMEPDEIVALKNKVMGWTIYPVYVDALKDVWIEE
ncbi:MAG: ABC transporter substrate-binding protein [Thermotogota bacterium]